MEAKVSDEAKKSKNKMDGGQVFIEGLNYPEG